GERHRLLLGEQRAVDETIVADGQETGRNGLQLGRCGLSATPVPHRPGIASAFALSDNLDLVRDDPDVDLLKAGFPDLFAGLEEGLGRWIVGVDANAEKIVAVAGAAVFPGAGYAARVLGDAAEALG